jgi:sulfatase modifying factor 1
MIMKTKQRSTLILTLSLALASPATAVELDPTEVTIGAFGAFVAATGTITTAEKSGGMVYEAGWVHKAGWHWRQPYGQDAHPDEPAVHITFDEAAAYCAWRGQRLPTRDEWIDAAYTEKRPFPPAPFVTGTTYRYPTGNTPDGANCRSDCGTEVTPPANKPDYSPLLWRGSGHARAGSTKQGVNGLYDMGANVWEWAQRGTGNQQATMGGSWWYGAAQMTADYGATKPRDMAVVYIGFRCAGRPAVPQ